MSVPNSLKNINVADVIEVVVEPSTTVGDYFGRLVDCLFNRPQEHQFDELLIAKTDARKIYQRAYPKAKV